MKFAFVLASLVALVAAQDATTESLEIVGGKEAAVGKHRYLAGLKSNPTDPISCGGSLIAPNAHFYNGTSDGEVVKITKEIKHPKFNATTISYDVAVFLLERSITTIQPVKVSFENVPAGVDTWVRGWGTTSDGVLSPVLKELNVKTWSNANANKVLDNFNKFDNSMLAAGGVLGEDACQGDSGGPLTIEDAAGVRLVGTVSWGVECAVADRLGVYARLSAARSFLEPFLKSSKPKVKAVPYIHSSENADAIVAADEN
ncbi:hypothetical protein LEN26_001602 [Aphanomyces euteiches]|nr:hypothetical protein LEN26_001602 [Aphanomyces euteiches]